MAADLMENVSTGRDLLWLCSTLGLSETLPPPPEGIPGTGGQTRLASSGFDSAAETTPTLLHPWTPPGHLRPPLLTGPRDPQATREAAFPSPVELQRVTVALMHDLVLRQATVAV